MNSTQAISVIASDLRKSLEGMGLNPAHSAIADAAINYALQIAYRQGQGSVSWAYPPKPLKDIETCE